MIIRPFALADQAAVIALWQTCGLTRAWNDPQQDIARKLRQQPELFLVGTVGAQVVATVMAGFDGHRGWVNYLAVDPREQRRGFGRALMREVEQRLAERGCPKLNLQVRAGNDLVLAFYERLGYRPDAVVSLGKRLSEDR